MSNIKLMSGFYSGCIVEGDRPIIDIAFEKLSVELQCSILSYGIGKYFPGSHEEDLENFTLSSFPISIEELITEYEMSWERQDTDESANLWSLSSRRVPQLLSTESYYGIPYINRTSKLAYLYQAERRQR